MNFAQLLSHWSRAQPRVPLILGQISTPTHPDCRKHRQALLGDGCPSLRDRGLNLMPSIEVETRSETIPRCVRPFLNLVSSFRSSIIPGRVG